MWQRKNNCGDSAGRADLSDFTNSFAFKEGVGFFNHKQQGNGRNSATFLRDEKNEVQKKKKKDQIESYQITSSSSGKDCLSGSNQSGADTSSSRRCRKLGGLAGVALEPSQSLTSGEGIDLPSSKCHDQLLCGEHTQII